MDKKKLIGFAVMVGAQILAMVIYDEMRQRYPEKGR